MKHATSDEVDAAVSVVGWHKGGHVEIATKVDMLMSEEELLELVRLQTINTRLLLRLAVKGL